MVRVGATSWLLVPEVASARGPVPVTVRLVKVGRVPSISTWPVVEPTGMTTSSPVTGSVPVSQFPGSDQSPFPAAPVHVTVAAQPGHDAISNVSTSREMTLEWWVGVRFIKKGAMGRVVTLRHISPAGNQKS